MEIIAEKENQLRQTSSVSDTSFSQTEMSGKGDITPTMLCGKFQEATWIGFGCVKVGIQSCRMFSLYNPENCSITIAVGKCPMKSGFNITLGPHNESSIVIEPKSTVDGHVYWTPNSNMSVREVAILLMNSKTKLQLTLHGIAGIGEHKVPSKLEQKSKKVPIARKGSFRANASGPKTSITNKHDSTNLMKKNSSNQLSFVESKANVYGDKWADKQVTCITRWMNEKISPQMHVVFSNIGPNYSSIDYQHQLQKHREEMCWIASEDSFVDVVERVESEIRSDRLAMREDQNIRANVGLKEEFMQILLSYDLLWLRLGLEVVLDITISPPATFNHEDAQKMSPEKASELWHSSLKRAINNHIFYSEELHSIHVKPGVIMTPSLEHKYHRDMCKHILRSFLVLVLLLDKCRIRGLCGRRHRLFSKHSVVKSSKDVLILFCRKFLKAEANIIKHLASRGYNVEYVQRGYDEFDFIVKNISSDLKDGVRLCHLVNVLSAAAQEDTTYDGCYQYDLIKSSLLRIPAVSRLQKLHNVGLVTKTLKELGVSVPVEDKHIVDGQQSSTLLLLWIILFEFDLKFMVSSDKIESEISRINARYIHSDESLLDTTNVESEQLFNSLRSSLLRWCQCISSIYNAHVYNLSSDLSNGRVIGLLIHYYLPSLLPRHIVYKILSGVGEDIDDNVSVLTEAPRHRSSDDRKVFAAISRACEQLGGIPTVIPTADSMKTLDERTIVMFLGFMFARLVDSSMKYRAAKVIQTFLRRYLIRSRETQCRRRTSKSMTVVNPKFCYSSRDAAHVITAFMKHIYSRRVESRTQLLEKGNVADIVEEASVGDELIEIESVTVESTPTDDTVSDVTAAVDETSVDIVLACDDDLMDVETATVESIPTDCAVCEVSLCAVDAIASEFDNELLDAESLTVDSTPSDNAFGETSLCDVGAVVDEPSFGGEPMDIETVTVDSPLIDKAFSETSLCDVNEAAVETVSTHASETAHESDININQVEKDMISDCDIVSRQLDDTVTRDSVMHEVLTGNKSGSEIPIELPSLVKFAAHAALMAEISQQSKLLEKVKAEADGRVAAEKMVLQLQADHLKALEEANSQRMELEAKLHHEVMERERIQAEYRAAALRAEEERLKREKEIYRKNVSALAIQSLFRVLQAKSKRKYRLQCVCRIQRVVRGSLVRRHMNILSSAAICIQKYFRQKKEQTTRMHKINSAGMVLQRWFSTCLKHKKAILETKAAVSIQSFLRTRALSQKYSTIKWCVLKLQSLYRKHLAVRFLNRARKAIAVISRMYLRALTRKHTSVQHAAMIIQNCWTCYRRKLSTYEAHNNKQKIKEFTIRLSQRRIYVFCATHARRLKEIRAVNSISRWFLCYLPLLRARKMGRGFLRLQAFRRSVIIRRHLCKTVKVALKRLNAAHKRSNQNPELRLGNQTIAALSTLQKGKMISHVLKACQTLETSTHYSQVCCKNFVLSSASKVLFTLIRSCNRSTPHQELLRCALSVLLNVTKDASLASKLSHNGDTTELLVDLMQMFRDKKTIFNLSCVLLTRIVVAQGHIKDECCSQDIRKRLDGIQHILERKHRLDMRVKSINSSKLARVSPKSGCGSIEKSPYELISALITSLEE